jgi:fused signal recognition particle receptor
MSRTWAELLGDAEAGEREDSEGTGFFSRLRDSLGKSRRALAAELGGSFDPSEEDAWERLEIALIRADVGVPATAELVRRLESRGDVTDLGEALAEELELLFGEPPLLAAAPEPPTVVLVVGVNGTGKTTTIGKLARTLSEHGRSVLVAAADTFRAAADEQLEIWAERAGADFVGGSRGADPAAVAFDAIEAGRARGRDVVIVDTAGRLHTQQHLMDELRKVRNVIDRQAPGAPHETLLVIDATTGQNGLRQALLFREAVEVTGIALTKLDGTAKGGIALAIAQELAVPVKLIGIGEALEDLRPFDADDFARAILEP